MTLGGPIHWFFRLFGRLPLPFLHLLGIAVGWLVYGLDRRYRERLRSNLSIAYGDNTRLRRRSIGEMGKSISELPAIWGRDYEDVLRLVREVHGWEKVEALAGRGIVFMTPHLGCFEIAAAYIAAQRPITVLYRPPKLKVLAPLMRLARSRGSATLAMTDYKGVKQLLKSLKIGESVGILPDQVPSVGDGIDAPFFGREAYTMSLSTRLIQATGAAAVMVAAVRLPFGRGFVLYFEPLTLTTSAPEAAAASLNHAIEKLVRRFPEQYLWSYNRYKRPSVANSKSI